MAMSPLAYIEMIRDEEPEPPSVHNSAVSDRIDDLVLALLAKEPVQRPSSAGAVAEYLRGAQHGKGIRPTPYNRDSTPILAVRATTSTAGRAVVGAAMLGDAPQIAVGAVTTPLVLADLVRATGLDPSMQLAVDTRVEATTEIAMPETIKKRPYAPIDGTPYRHVDLRGAETCKRVARGDLSEQDREGASFFRSACFAFAGSDDAWIKRNPRLLSDQTQARDAINAQAPLYATIRCHIDGLVRSEDRISVANRFSREIPEGFWFEVYGLSIHASPEAISAALEMFLLMQERGVPSVVSLPGSLVELAWSIGIAGAEVKLGRVGGAHAPTSRVPTNADRRPRFELLSVFGSFAPEDATSLLELNLLPESECDCATCQLGGTVEDRVANADAHGIATWVDLQRQLAGLSVVDRIERLRGRFSEAEELLAEARGTLPKGRGSSRHVRKLRTTLELLDRRGALESVGKLKRSSSPR